MTGILTGAVQIGILPVLENGIALAINRYECGLLNPVKAEKLNVHRKQSVDQVESLVVNSCCLRSRSVAARLMSSDAARSRV
jgi:hypothetical protein